MELILYYSYLFIEIVILTVILFIRVISHLKVASYLYSMGVRTGHRN